MELTRQRHREHEEVEGKDEVSPAAAVVSIMCCKAFGGSRSLAVVASVACLCILYISALFLLLPSGTAAASSSLSHDSEYSPWSSRASSLSSSTKAFVNQVQLAAAQSSSEGGSAGRRLLQLRHPPGNTRRAGRASSTLRTLMFAAGPGSYPPRCTAKCGSCTPCKPVHVPVPPGRLVTTMEYYPEAWRCKCGNVLYMP